MPGCALGPFDIVGPLLPHGAFDVYRAADTRSNQTVTLKFLGDDLSHDDARRAQLLRDAESIGAFSHPHVASLLEIGEDEDQGGMYAVYEDVPGTFSYTAYENVPGTSLQEVLAQRHFSASRAVALSRQLGETVADIHGAGLVHGNLGPVTVMITPAGTASILFLGAGASAGGPRPFIAPERARGAVFDDRADVYSLGALLALMLTGRIMEAGAAPADVARRIDSALPGDLRRIVMSALAGDPASRCGSAAAFAAELSGVAAVMDLRKR